MPSERGTAPIPELRRYRYCTDTCMSTNWCANLSVVSYKNCSFFQTIVIQLVILSILLRWPHGIIVKIAGDKLVFVFLLFFPRRYRSGFTTRWHGKRTILQYYNNMYTYALVVVVLSRWFYFFTRCCWRREKARVGARVRTFWPGDISDSPPPSPVCFKLLLYICIFTAAAATERDPLCTREESKTH